MEFLCKFLFICTSLNSKSKIRSTFYFIFVKNLNPVQILVFECKYFSSGLNSPQQEFWFNSEGCSMLSQHCWLMNIWIRIDWTATLESVQLVCCDAADHHGIEWLCCIQSAPLFSDDDVQSNERLEFVACEFRMCDPVWWAPVSAVWWLFASSVAEPMWMRRVV